MNLIEIECILYVRLEIYNMCYIIAHERVSNKILFVFQIIDFRS